MSNKEKTLTPRKEAASYFGPDIRHWTDAQITEYLDSKTIPKKTKRGNWVISILRSHDLRSWKSEELLDWVEGLIEYPDVLEDEDIWGEIYTRWKIPGNWFFEDAKVYVLTNKKPDEIAPGVLVNDRNRAEKSLSQLSHTEISHALSGIISLRFTREELLGELKVRSGLRQDWPDDRILNAAPIMEKEMSDINMILTAKLEEYKKLRLNDGRTPSPETEAGAQKIFWLAICSVLDRRDYRQFQEGFNLILDFIDKNYPTLFIEKMSARNLGKASLTPNEKETFAGLLNMMVQTRSPKRRRQEAKIFNLDVIMRHSRSEIRKQNLLQFYGFNDE